MNITMINGAPAGEWRAFEEALYGLKETLSSQHKVDIFTVRDLDIHYCVGCFKCWVKTPGRCVFKDDMPDVLKSIIHADLELCISPAIAGFVSADTKKTMDRMLPALLPYLRIFDGEFHHPLRYDKMPNLGVILMDDGNLDEETKEITFGAFERLTKNMHCSRLVKKTATAENIAEVIENETRAY